MNDKITVRKIPGRDDPRWIRHEDLPAIQISAGQCQGNMYYSLEFTRECPRCGDGQETIEILSNRSEIRPLIELLEWLAVTWDESEAT